ncbi:uncharacterized protein Z518_03066 [Rhinocladiella mackenziei CBS 650.93]|uniref:Rhinocladiella mackenziei CBS 650.93 unplaced genomic scaffold supercont1.2, whole genome shotgun sequence n=1 Tax=Rhinocladiella mackenziei CBS 650.93 TaxID=1442369 RepID=A0A0D2JGE8_9EURO|nr:uncharacterized protein Z518_03066 [Rhinocladiella mackenziei CBS 650.93]KIX08410.1 hypothetical protein Z518_03066 [Rhinocladiella mackenziei CBS 650.93]
MVPHHPAANSNAIMNSPPGATSANKAKSGISMPGVRAQIKRGRTGCFTCRRRRKKCDETKPQCIGCLRSGYICEGYPAIVRYEEHKTKRLSQSQSQSPEGQAQCPSQIPAQTSPAIHNVNSAATVAQQTTVEGNDAFLHWFLPDDTTDNFGVMVNYGNSNLSTAMDGSIMEYPQMDTATSTLQQQLSYQLQQRQQSSEAEIPRSIPFLINGVDSRTEQKFFFHFTNVTSRVLTISNNEKNPLLTIVLPRSLDDPMISKAIACLGGSHLANLQPESELQTQAEKNRILKNAVTQQTARMMALRASGPRQTSAEFEAILTSTLLLCLYEISEGSGNLTWRVRLDEARDLIQDALRVSCRGNHDMSCSLQALSSLGIDQFLLDFFVYHDILAGVTDPMHQPLLKSTLRASSQTEDEVYMIGVDNGLFDLIAQIVGLRSSARTHGRSNPVVIFEAIQIWEALDAWKPNTDDRDQTLAFSAYTSALFVWLYSIIYPDNIGDDKVKIAVRNGLDNMHQIQARGVLAFLLFPAFVLGIASVTPEHRSEISAVFERLRNFSALGNVKLAYEVVKRSWLDYGRGIPRSWDWIQQMEVNRISLPVT